jgi:diadenosine tetraphosphate (Ap4A) HIT family hydrolase
MTSESSSLELPQYVEWSLFPFEGALRVKTPTWLDHDLVRSGEPGGAPCQSCTTPDDDYVWVDEHWRVFARPKPSVVPALLFLETRAHVDLDGLEDVLATELGPMIIRLSVAMQAIGDVGRVQVYRWGDGAKHFHMWFYARPVGAMNLLGFGMPLWEPILPAIPEEQWRANVVTVARALEVGGGRAMVR